MISFIKTMFARQLKNMKIKVVLCASKIPNINMLEPTPHKLYPHMTPTTP